MRSTLTLEGRPSDCVVSKRPDKPPNKQTRDHCKEGLGKLLVLEGSQLNRFNQNGMKLKANALEAELGLRQFRHCCLRDKVLENNVSCAPEFAIDPSYFSHS